MRINDYMAIHHESAIQKDKWYPIFRHPSEGRFPVEFDWYRSTIWLLPCDTLALALEAIGESNHAILGSGLTEHGPYGGPCNMMVWTHKPDGELERLRAAAAMMYKALIFYAPKTYYQAFPKRWTESAGGLYPGKDGWQPSIKDMIPGYRERFHCAILEDGGDIARAAHSYADDLLGFAEFTMPLYLETNGPDWWDDPEEEDEC